MNNRKFTSLVLTLCLLLAGCGMPDNKKEEEKGKEYPDRAMYELKGNVKSVKTIVNNSGVDEPSYELAFDKNGKCTKHMLDGTWDEDEEHLYSIARNDKNRITAYTATGKESKKKKTEVHYNYDGNGRITSVNSMWYEESVVTESFEYNDNGDRSRYSIEVLDYNYRAKETINYRYRDFDDKGNWTAREGLRIVENENKEIVSENIFVEKREIEYYE